VHRVKKESRSIGDHLRSWRERRRLSQLELSLRAEVSARHLSFVETGRAAPGRELVLRLGEELGIPLRERNTLLVAAGFAPIFQQRRFDDPSFDSVRAILDLALEKQKPFPAYVIDRHWTVVASNAAVPELYEGVAPELVRPPINVIRLMLNPRGMAPRIVNFAAWRTHLLAQVRRQLSLTADPFLEGLLREALAFPAGKADDAGQAAIEGPAMLLEVETRLGCLSFLGATTVFGTPADVTLEEIALEILYPADAFTDKTVRAAAAAPAAAPTAPLPPSSLRATTRPAAREANATPTPAARR
jgi:transcriptional regulator with XRE-family HTH domain